VLTLTVEARDPQLRFTAMEAASPRSSSALAGWRALWRYGFAAAQDPRLKTRDVYGVVSKSWAVGGTGNTAFDLPSGAEAPLSTYLSLPVA
jgi:hypothetical protein